MHCSTLSTSKNIVPAADVKPYFLCSNLNLQREFYAKISRVTSGYTMTSYSINWIWQKPGKALEWMGWINTETTGASYASAFQNRFTFTQDVPSTTHYFEIKSDSWRYQHILFTSVPKKSPVTVEWRTAAQKPQIAMWLWLVLASGFFFYTSKMTMDGSIPDFTRTWQLSIEINSVINLVIAVSY